MRPDSARTAYDGRLIDVTIERWGEHDREIVEHVQRKIRAGYQEIVLTGIHLGDYHPDDDRKQDLGDLIATLRPWNR